MYRVSLDTSHCVFLLHNLKLVHIFWNMNNMLTNFRPQGVDSCG